MVKLKAQGRLIWDFHNLRPMRLNGQENDCGKWAFGISSAIKQ
jgi:hypothetical protein